MSRDSRAAWALTRAISPRLHVRLAVRDAYGNIPNRYPIQRLTSGDAPTEPWAVLLARTDGTYRNLALDFDESKGEGTATTDAIAAAELLARAGIPTVTTRSSAQGGWHVWAASADPVPAETIRELAQRAPLLWPSLDTAPLTNPAAGCVRPPGAPHRDGSVSEVTAGDVDVLISPPATADNFADFVDRLPQRPAREPRQDAASAEFGVAADGHRARKRIPGRLPAPIRALVERGAAAITGPARDTSPSAVFARILVSAINAGWSLTDLQTEIARHPDAPGFTTVATKPSPTGRGPRERRIEPARYVITQWDESVRWVEAHPPINGATDDQHRVDEDLIVEAVATCQSRADAMPSRWLRPGGPSDRIALDHLCEAVLASLRLEVEAAERTVAIRTGLSRATVRAAFDRLIDDQIITRVRDSTGTRGHIFRLGAPTAEPQQDRQELHISANPIHPQAQRPPDRHPIVQVLKERLDALRHDVFTDRDLPRGALLTARQLSHPISLDDLCASTGLDEDTTTDHLDLLARHGILTEDDGRPVLRPRDELDLVAEKLDVAGTLERRETAYRLEQACWEWWCHELTYLRTPTRRKPRIEPINQVSAFEITGSWPRYLRQSDGRPDHSAARSYLACYGRPDHRDRREDAPPFVMAIAA